MQDKENKMRNIKILLLTLSLALGLVNTTQAEPLTSTQLHATMGIVTNFILSDGITHNGTNYGAVTSPYTGRVWLDRNLGASRVCTSLDDTQCYGDYYQWGRGFDGHQSSTSDVTSLLATDVNSVGHGNFITNGSFPYDWVSGDNDGNQRFDNWLKKDASSVCPVGFRVPTITELKTETLDEGVTNNTTAFSNFLKFPSSGTRSGFSGSLDGISLWGSVWSASLNGSDMSLLGFDSSDAAVYINGKRVHGQSVRCIKQITPEEVVHNGTLYGTVTSPYTGKVWLDRNLGANRVCTSLDDTECYGDYYQWGRNADGHEENNSSNATLATNVNNVGHSDFIINTNFPYDWASVDATGVTRTSNWSKTDGTAVCPVGFRVPNLTELQSELLDVGSAEITDHIDAFNSFLKFPSGGKRNNSTAILSSQDSWGFVWSSTVSISYTSYIYFNSGNAYTQNGNRASGMSIRCMKD